jgi:hypothetical protein
MPGLRERPSLSTDRLARSDPIFLQLMPRAAVTLYFFLAVFLIVPFGELARLLFRRS